MNDADSPPIAGDSGDILRSLFVERGGVRGVFSSKVTDYVAARPGYPDAVYDALRDLGALPAVPSTVADLGAGTGLFSQGLLVRGHHVYAVEPNAAMRDAAHAFLHSYAGYRGIDGSAESTTLEDESVDLVTVAQAFHWFEIEPTRRECLRILRPDGQVALIWNDRLLTDPLQKDIETIFAEFGGVARQALAAHESRDDVLRFFHGAAAASVDLPHEHLLDRAALQSVVFSRSYMPPRQSEAGCAAAARVDGVFDKHAVSDRVTMRYRTVATIGRPGSPT